MSRPNLIQSLVICEKFPQFPNNNLNTPTHQNFLRQKKLISICYENLKVNPTQYGGEKSVSLDRIQNTAQIYRISKGIFEQSKEIIKNRNEGELKLFKILYNTKKLGDYKTLDEEDLKEKIAIVIYDNGLDNKKISKKFEEDLIWELKHTPRIEDYL